MSRAAAASDWDQLAELQASLRALDSGAPLSGMNRSVARGVRLRLARLALDDRIRSEYEAGARARRAEFELALAGFAERAAERARGTRRPLALPAPTVPTTPPGPPAPAAATLPAPAPARSRANPARSRRAAPARTRARPAPPPEFWSPRPVLGFRVWELRGRLQGACQAWEGPYREARCVSGRAERDDGEVPHTDGRCGHPPCGIYAFKEPAQLLAAFGLPEGSRRNVYGLVALSGKVVEHERGYRAQRVTVIAAAVLGRGLVVRVEGREWLQCLFLAPEDTVAGLVDTDREAVEAVDSPLEAAQAVIAYLSLAADLYEAATP